MHRIDTATAVATKPPKKAAGTPGFFDEGNAAAGSPATIVGRDFLNSVMDEIANVVEGAGLTLDKTDDSQLLGAINTIFAGAGGSSGKPRGHLAGLGLSNNVTDAANDIDIAVGSARGSNDNFDMVRTAVLTKRIDAIWAAGSNAGGLFGGAKAADTWYHVHLIRKDSDGAIDAGFDVSAAAANIPAGHTAFRRLGSVLTDATSNIIAFKQVGDEFQWTNAILDVSGTIATVAALYTLSTPPGVRCDAMLNTMASLSGGQAQGLLSSPDVADQAPSLTLAPLESFHDSTLDASAPMMGRIRTNLASQIRGRSALATYNFWIATLGWIDTRGRDD